MRVDFYILKNMDHTQSHDYLCKLIDKIYQRKHRIYIHTNDESDAHKIDDLLWTFRDTSFIPHNLVGEGPEMPPPVQIGYDEKPEKIKDVLINLHQDIPSFYKQFRRVLEIVPNEESAKNICRDHFRYYKSQGCELHTHDIT